MATNTKPILVPFPAAVKDCITLAAMAHGVSLSQYVRQAVAKALIADGVVTPPVAPKPTAPARQPRALNRPTTGRQLRQL